MSSLLLEAADSALAGLREVKIAKDVPSGDFTTWVAASILVHTLLFFILPASPWLPKKGEVPEKHRASGKPYDRAHASVQIRNGLVSTVHATVCCIAVAAWFTQYKFESWNWQRNMQGGFDVAGNSNGDGWLAVGICNTVGYFIYDTLCMAYYRLGNVGAYVHHLCIGIALAIGLVTGTGRFYHFIFLLEELSTPSLNMKNLYPQTSRAYKLWAASFAALFFLCRGAFGLTMSCATYWCLFTYWGEYRGEFVARGSYWFDFVVGLQFVSFSISRMLNIYWMSLIAQKVLCDKPRPKRARVQQAAAAVPDKMD